MARKIKHTSFQSNCRDYSNLLKVWISYQMIYEQVKWKCHSADLRLNARWQAFHYERLYIIALLSVFPPLWHLNSQCRNHFTFHPIHQFLDHFFKALKFKCVNFPVDANYCWFFPRSSSLCCIKWIRSVVFTHILSYNEILTI